MPRIALAQLEAHDDVAENREKILDAMRCAAKQGANLIAFPELALSKFFPQHPDFPNADRKSVV